MQQADIGGRREWPEDLGPLLGGYHGLSREQVAYSQRERLLATLAQQVAGSGYRALTVTALTKAASVSTRDFYEIFESKEACFLATFEAVTDHLVEIATAAAASEEEWHDQVIAATRAALEFFAEEPVLARLCLVESVSATPRISARFREAVLACAPGLARGGDQLAGPDALLPGAEVSIIGGVISLATQRVLAGETELLPELLPDMVDFALSPYLGAERAARLAADARAD